jgi:hypothetical protein
MDGQELEIEVRGFAWLVGALWSFLSFVSSFLHYPFFNPPFFFEISFAFTSSGRSLCVMHYASFFGYGPALGCLVVGWSIIRF